MGRIPGPPLYEALCVCMCACMRAGVPLDTEFAPVDVVVFVQAVMKVAPAKWDALDEDAKIVS